MAKKIRKVDETGNEVLGKVKLDEVEFDIIDKYYEHQQINASKIWTVNHNLGKQPSVMIFDSTGRVVLGDVEHLSNNSLLINLNEQISGTANCN